MTSDASYPDLRGRTAFITGGARGIGLAVGEALARCGMNIAVGDLSPDVEQTAETLAKQHGVQALGVRLDVTDPNSVAEAISAATAAVGRPTVLVNSAGIGLNASALEVTREQWERVMSVNVTGTVLVSQAFAKSCLQDGLTGSIVNLASMSARIVNVPQQQSAYNASKAAVEALTRSFAVEWIRSGIRVNAVSPGYILTDMTRDFVAGEPEMARSWRERIPEGEMGTPQDVAGMVAYLASNESRYVVGQSMVIDGGYTLV